MAKTQQKHFYNAIEILPMTSWEEERLNKRQKSENNFVKNCEEGALQYFSYFGGEQISNICQARIASEQWTISAINICDVYRLHTVAYCSYAGNNDFYIQIPSQVLNKIQ